MNDFQAKKLFDIAKCRTLRRGQIDLFDCLAAEQVFICIHALPFGYGHFCKHPQRNEFGEKSPKNQPVNSSQSNTSE
jgi:hypothetical protein